MSEKMTSINPNILVWCREASGVSIEEASLKFGAEKARIIVMITFLIVFAISNLLKEKLGIIPNLIDTFSLYSFNITTICIIVLFLIVLGISVKISIKIMEKKQY